MTNVDRWPEAFENGIPKVGGRWVATYGREITVTRFDGDMVHDHETGRHYLWRFVGAKAADSIGFMKAFLGFADSVNQGAAAPQKPARIVQPCACGELCQNATAATLWPEPVPYVGALHHPSGCIPESAPIVAPPPSLKAAVQQAGLGIPKQPWVRHEQWEEDARAYEKDGDLSRAKAARRNAQEKLAADLAYDAEASAIRENRVITKIALQEMGRGDRECFKLRNLREFTAIKSAEHAKWNWWRKP